MTKPHVSRIPPAEFERMQVLARANGFALKSESEVFRICYLADVFRKVYHVGDMVPHTRQRRALDPCPTIGAAPCTIIRRGKEVAENRQRPGVSDAINSGEMMPRRKVKGPAVKRGP